MEEYWSDLPSAVCTKSKDQYVETGLSLIIPASSEVRWITLALTIKSFGYGELYLKHDGKGCWMSKFPYPIVANLLVEPKRDHEFSAWMRSLDGDEVFLYPESKMHVAVLPVWRDRPIASARVESKVNYQLNDEQQAYCEELVMAEAPDVGKVLDGIIQVMTADYPRLGSELLKARRVCKMAREVLEGRDYTALHDVVEEYEACLRSMKL